MDYKEKLIALLNDKDLSQEQKEKLEQIFPLEQISSELKESEDERIRKEIIELVWQPTWRTEKEYFRRKELVAWLEKQGDKNSQVILPTFTFDDILALQCCMETVKKVQEDKDLYEKLDDLHGRVYDAYHLEKQVEQKPVDKVEPKFHEGDWITDGYLHYKITDVLEDRYIVDTKFVKRSAILFNNESRYHLWTIKDAKDGDVLYCEGDGIEYIVMSKGVNKHGNIDSYFRYNSLNGFSIDIPNVLSSRQDNITPATKEQRDLLFSKMKEAGYEWDAEKKELKKIEQKSTENEELTEFDKAVGVSIGTWNPKTPEQIKSVKAVSKKLLELAKKQINDEQKPTWSEEDEHRINDIIGLNSSDLRTGGSRVMSNLKHLSLQQETVLTTSAKII